MTRSTAVTAQRLAQRQATASTSTSTPTDLHPVEALLLIALLLVNAIALLLVNAIALALTIARWRPPAPAAVPAPAAAPAPAPAAAPAASPYASLTVVQLRSLARRAGLPALLCRSGRRADLLAALNARPAPC